MNISFRPQFAATQHENSQLCGYRLSDYTFFEQLGPKLAALDNTDQVHFSFAAGYDGKVQLKVGTSADTMNISTQLGQINLTSGNFHVKNDNIDATSQAAERLIKNTQPKGE